MTELIREDGRLEYRPGFLAPTEALDFFKRLRLELAWRTEMATDAGSRFVLPRAVAWHGEADAVYPYAGFTHRPEPWTATLKVLKARVEAACGQTFNGVLGNFYRDGTAGMGWHADREPVLGKNPVIASLSLGAPRVMGFRHESSGRELEVLLEPGSLLVMGGSLQHHWLHCLPERPEQSRARLNLNFRHLLAAVPAARSNDRPPGEPERSQAAKRQDR